MEEKKIKISLEGKEVVELKGKEVEVFLWVWSKYHIWEHAISLKPGFLGLHFDANNDIGKLEIERFGKDNIDKYLSSVIK